MEDQAKEVDQSTNQVLDDYRGSWKESPLDTLKRRSWAIEEEKFRREIKKIASSASAGYQWLMAILTLTGIVLIYMIAMGTDPEQVALGIAAMLGGGGGTGLAYRYFNKAKTATSQIEQKKIDQVQLTPTPILPNAPKEPEEDA